MKIHRIAIIGLVIIGTIILANSVFAGHETTISQPIKDTASASGNNHWQRLGQLNNNTGITTINSYTFSASTTTEPSTISLIMEGYTDSGYTTFSHSWQLHSGNSGKVAGETCNENHITFSLTTTQADYIVPYNDPTSLGADIRLCEYNGTTRIVRDSVEIDPNIYYRSTFNRFSGNSWTRFGSSTDEYANGSCELGCGSVSDYYFILTAPSVSGGTRHIDITVPSDGTTYTTTAVQDNGIIVAGFCNYSGSITAQIFSQNYGWQIDQKSSTCAGGEFSILLDTSNVFNDDYTINVFDLIGPGSTNDSITVTVNISGNTVPQPEPAVPDSDDPASPFFVDCSAYDAVNFFNDGVFAGISCYTKKTVFSIASFLFEPQQFAKDLVENEVIKIKGSFPFSAFFVLTDTIAENIETAPAGQTLSIHIPPPLDHTFEILTPTLMADVVGVDFKNDVFDTISTVVWLMVGFGILAIIF